MKKMLLTIVLAIPAMAETVYTQSAPVGCNLSTWVCQDIPLVGGGYYRFLPGFLQVNAQMPALDAWTIQGNPNDYSTMLQMPTVQEGAAGGIISIVFVITDTNGVQHSGHVDGHGHWTIFRGRAYPFVDSSIVTID